MISRNSYFLMAMLLLSLRTESLTHGNRWRVQLGIITVGALEVSSRDKDFRLFLKNNWLMDLFFRFEYLIESSDGNWKISGQDSTKSLAMFGDFGSDRNNIRLKVRNFRQIERSISQTIASEDSPNWIDMLKATFGNWNCSEFMNWQELRYLDSELKVVRVPISDKSCTDSNWTLQLALQGKSKVRVSGDRQLICVQIPEFPFGLCSTKVLD